MKQCAGRLRRVFETLTPEQAALLLAVGLVLGVFPMAGIPTLLCLLAAFGLRLNAGALQVINNLTSPLQLALLLPLERAGAWLLRDHNAAGASLPGRFGGAVLHALAGWVCICIPVGVLVYFGLIFSGKRMRGSWWNGVETTIG